jgi:hypothetical protein
MNNDAKYTSYDLKFNNPIQLNFDSSHKFSTFNKNYYSF